MNHDTNPRKQANGSGGISNESTPAISPVQSQSPKFAARAKLPVSSRLPLPVSVELHNLFPKPQRVNSSGQQHGNKQRWFRPEYTTDLLCAVEMEISVAEDDDPGDETMSRTVLYSVVDHRRTVCPAWHHLSDYIQHKDLTVQTYENMCATFHTCGNAAGDNDEKDPSDTATTTIICRVPLHPSKLYKISDPPPYDHLPINCALVRYTDNTVRVQASHYQLISSHQGRRQTQQLNGTVLRVSDPGTTVTLQTSSSAMTPSANGTALLKIDPHSLPGGALEDFRRFEDKSFRALDLVATPSRTRSASSASDASPSLVLQESMQRLSIDEMVGVSTSFSSSHHHHNESADDRANFEYLTHETAVLEWLLQQEERAWDRETEELQGQRQALRQLVVDIEQTQAQTDQVRRAIAQEQKETQNTEFRLDASRIRLVRELAFIYPITTAINDSHNSNNNRRRWLIRGLEVPAADLLWAGPEEEVAAALGMLAHTVHLLSKYLDVHLRFRIHCHGSRSAMQDMDAATVYPLFPARAVDREQLAFAVHLLDRNVDCILQCQGIVLTHMTMTHMLVKIKRIYEHVVEGY